MLENLVPPIPSEVILPLAGFRARTGALNVWAVWPASTAGSVAGALLLYGLGAWLGYDRLHSLAGKRWFILTGQKDLEGGRQLLGRHRRQDRAGRPLRPFHPKRGLGSGRNHQHARGLLTAIGSVVWNALLVALGWLLGENWEQVQRWLEPISYMVLGLLAFGLVALAVRKLRHA